mmetsp:Transcript_33936/g.108208  ORF Transcript_33936/g.108208 Transcript_33936/m.108208 type:complete len:255 (+) Transcript_33936:376-1140(+)
MSSDCRAASSAVLPSSSLACSSSAALTGPPSSIHACTSGANSHCAASTRPWRIASCSGAGVRTANSWAAATVLRPASREGCPADAACDAVSKCLHKKPRQNRNRCNARSSAAAWATPTAPSTVTPDAASRCASWLSRHRAGTVASESSVWHCRMTSRDEPAAGAKRSVYTYSRSDRRAEAEPTEREKRDAAQWLPSPEAPPQVAPAPTPAAAPGTMLASSAGLVGGGRRGPSAPSSTAWTTCRPHRASSTTRWE